MLKVSLDMALSVHCFVVLFRTSTPLLKILRRVRETRNRSLSRLVMLMIH